MLVSTLFIFTVACEKDDIPSQDSTDDQEVVVKQITESLAGQGNLNSFIEAFENLDMSDEDMAEGITIFAPVDDALQADGHVSSGQARSTADTTTSALTPEVLKDHIVKGIIEAANLSNGDTLTTLSGKQLKVVIDGDDISVNGVLISGKNVATHTKYVVHTVAEVIRDTEPQKNTGTIEVMVWNGAKWSADKPTGETEAGVMILLYKSREDYAQGNVAYTQETGADGKAIFTDVDVYYVDGNSNDLLGYYIEAKKGDLSNIFYKSAQTEEGLYTGFAPEGLFQTQAEVESSAPQSNAVPGNFRWKDVNGDAIISEYDRIALPHNYVEAVSSQMVQVEVTIGYDDNQGMSPVQSREAALQLLEDSYQKLDGWQKNLVMADGMLSDDADCGNMMSWCEIDNFSFSSTNTTFTKLWQDGYQNIGQLNKLLRDVPLLSFAEKAEVIAQAKGLRAYIYLQLLNYFGNTPLQTSVEMDDNIAQSSTEEVYNFIIMDLESAASVLPMKWSSDKRHQISAGASKMLLAKAALWKKDYQKAAAYTDEVLQSSSYQLAANDTLLFADASNAEIIWDFSFNLSSEFSTYFYGRSFCPALRLAEVYLMNAEAQFMVGNTGAGVNHLNIIRDRMGMPPASSSEELSSTWKAAMSREGSRFVNLLRWKTAMDVLSPKGFAPHHSLLPVPQVFIDSFPNLIQNPGY